MNSFIKKYNQLMNDFSDNTIETKILNESFGKWAKNVFTKSGDDLFNTMRETWFNMLKKYKFEAVRVHGQLNPMIQR